MQSDEVGPKGMTASSFWTHVAQQLFHSRAVLRSSLVLGAVAPWVTARAR